MKKQRVAILGAGISGLSLAWYLSKTAHPPEIVLFEKSGRSGGWLHTDRSTEFLFEKGPRTFKVSKASSLIQLSCELNLQEQMIFSSEKPHHRYLWIDQKLQRFPTHVLSFLFSPLTRGFLPALLTEWTRSVQVGDETVWDFVQRRFNKEVARRFFDPLVVGIFGGDIRKLSIKACFPMLKMWEETYGSVTRGFLSSRTREKGDSLFPPNGIFSFKEGVETLVQALSSQLRCPIYHQEPVEALYSRDQSVILSTAKRKMEVDHLFLALPVQESGDLLKTVDPESSRALLDTPSLGIAVVNFGYRQNVLPVEGFGYLIPSEAKEEIKGVIFDSSVFSEQNRGQQQTRLTIKMEEDGRSDAKYVESALKGIRKHLGISDAPHALSIKRAVRAIPQYRVGHLEKMEALSERLRKKCPRIHLHGNYLSGVSVDHCIERSRQLADSTVIY
jgi:oxygen-dependent protoporphyrinogen oxidase